MTLDEAIRYALEVAETNDCEECRAEHRQLAEWLQELRAARQEVEKLQETLHFLKVDHQELIEERTAIAKALEYEEKLKREARAEKERLRRVLEEAREEIQNCYRQIQMRLNWENWLVTKSPHGELHIITKNRRNDDKGDG